MVFEMLPRYLASSTHNWSQWRMMFRAENPAGRCLEKIPSRAHKETVWESQTRMYWRDGAGNLRYQRNVRG